MSNDPVESKFLEDQVDQLSYDELMKTSPTLVKNLAKLVRVDHQTPEQIRQTLKMRGRITGKTTLAMIECAAAYIQNHPEVKI